MQKTWMYFGCHGGPGHYLFVPNMSEISHHRELRKLLNFDGLLPLQLDRTPYVATVSRLGAWGLTALAFWDYSVDSRQGSNSIIFAPSLDIAPEDLLTGARKAFPRVFERLPEVTLYVPPAPMPLAQFIAKSDPMRF